MTAATALPGKPAATQAVSPLGVMLGFLVHGLVVATWVSRLPSIKAALGLSDGALGLALLGTAAGSIAGIVATGALVSRIGSRHAAQWTSVAFSASLIAPALARDGVTLFFALAIYGLMGGANDVALNAQAVGTERLMGRPAMSRFHAMFSAGGIAGSAAGGWIASLGVPALSHLAMAMLAFAMVAGLSGRWMADTAQSGAPRRRKMIFTRAILVVSTVGFCIFLSEGAMADWTAVYLRQVLRASEGLAPIGYAVFSATMAIFRFAGDAITMRIGRVNVVRFGGMLAACGIGLAAIAPSPLWAILGFAATGAGFSSIIPLVFAAGGRTKSVSEGQGVATVSGIGYLGFLIGPPAIGFLSEVASLRAGLGLLVALSVLAAALARAVE